MSSISRRSFVRQAAGSLLVPSLLTGAKPVAPADVVVFRPYATKFVDPGRIPEHYRRLYRYDRMAMRSDGRGGPLLFLASMTLADCLDRLKSCPAWADVEPRICPSAAGPLYVLDVPSFARDLSCLGCGKSTDVSYMTLRGAHLAPSGKCFHGGCPNHCHAPSLATDRWNGYDTQFVLKQDAVARLDNGDYVWRLTADYRACLKRGEYGAYRWAPRELLQCAATGADLCLRRDRLNVYA